MIFLGSNRGQRLQFKQTFEFDRPYSEILCLLTEFGLAEWENTWLEVMTCEPGLSLYIMTLSQIFS